MNTITSSPLRLRECGRVDHMLPLHKSRCHGPRLTARCRIGQRANSACPIRNKPDTIQRVQRSTPDRRLDRGCWLYQTAQGLWSFAEAFRRQCQQKACALAGARGTEHCFAEVFTIYDAFFVHQNTVSRDRRTTTTMRLGMMTNITYPNRLPRCRPARNGWYRRRPLAKTRSGPRSPITQSTARRPILTPRTPGVLLRRQRLPIAKTLLAWPASTMSSLKTIRTLFSIWITAVTPPPALASRPSGCSSPRVSALSESDTGT